MLKKLILISFNYFKNYIELTLNYLTFQFVLLRIISKFAFYFPCNEQNHRTYRYSSKYYGR